MRTRMKLLFVVFLFLFICWDLVPWAEAVVTQAPITGEIRRITINDPANHWSGGTIVIGGQTIIIPRNLLLDLPANRLTLKQLFDQAPAACVALGETGLAKADRCNTTGTGGFATISANRTNGGNIIAGDVLIEKGKEMVIGTVTYINYAEGYFRLNGDALNPATTGVMVRLNDPTGRHTIQSGLGCVPGSPNCSPDPRFTLDPDNYTNVFSTGYPLCIPSTASRTFIDVLGLGTTTAQALPDGTGDVLCPDTNRSIIVPEPAVADSRRFAPIKIGDNITVEGSLETVNGVEFVSAHTTSVGRALTTQNLSTQPDYLFLEEVEVDAPGFQNQRARSLFIGFTTLAPTDVLIWSLHRDPLTNEAHELPLATVLGCDRAGGAGTCSGQGLIGAGANIFKIRHDVDFVALIDPKLNPCAHLNADPRMGLGFCPGGSTVANMFSILSPIPHEIQARTGHAMANPGLITLDINGNQATNGQYLFPFGMNLGGISVPEMVEINLDQLATPFIFEGIPWNLDRRLSPGGCIDTTGPGGVPDGIPDCEATPQPLDPFPFSGLDPRTQAATPKTTYNDPHYTASALNDPIFGASNRILSFVDPGLGKPNGNATVLSLTLVDPPAQPIAPVDPYILRRGFAVNDFDGDGKADIAVYRNAVGVWYIIPSSGTPGPYAVGWGGGAADKPVSGDFDGDGKADIAIYRVVEGGWYIIPSSGGPSYGIGWGGDPTDIAVPADYDGDGKTDITVYRSSNGVWFVVPSAGAAPYAVGWGGDPSDVPIGVW